MRRTKFMGAFTTVLMLGLLAGCGSENVAGNNQSGKQEDVTLRMSWWGDETRNKATLDAINLYMKENPHVKIQGEYSDYGTYYQKLVTQLAGGTAPDLMIVVDRWYDDLEGKKNFLKDLGTFKTIDFSTIDPNFEKTQLYNGKKYGYPAGLQGEIFLYNQDFFKKYNVPTSFTWDSLITIGKQVHEQNPNAYLFTTYDSDLDTLLRTYQKQLTGNQFIKDDYTLGFTKGDLTKIFTFEKALFTNNVAEPLSKSVLYGNQSNEDPEWIKGNLGMALRFTSLIPAYETNKSFPLGAAPMPTLPGMKDSGVFTGSSLVYVMNAATKYPEESAKFISWMANDPEAIKILGTSRGVPATQTGRDVLTKAGQLDDLTNSALNLTISSSSKVLPDNGISQNQELDKIFLNEIDKVGYGQVPPEQAADEMINQYQAKLKELKAQ